MNIVLSLLEKYSEQIGSPVHISINIDNAKSYLSFTLGKYEQHGNITVLLEPYELKEILVINGIIGEGSLVKKAVDSEKLDLDKKIEEYVYNTLAKYILQMLFAARGEILFPEIIPLSKHKEIFFKNRFQHN